MKKIYSTKSQGVTITELTIVIALLSIITVIFFLSYEFFVKKSKVTKIAIDAKEYTRTLESFHLVYGGLPGDLASAKRRISSDLIDGDGDGRIQNEMEQFQVWPHLSKSNMLEQNFQTLATNTTPELGINLPAIRNSDNLAIGVIYNTPSGYRANSFIIGGLNGRDVSRPVLTQGDIRLGDQKYDDNNPTGGSWMCGKNPPSPSDCNYNNAALDGENFMLYLPITRSLASGSSSSSCPAQSLQIGQLVANIPEIQPANTYTGNCRGINANYAGTYQVKCSQQTNGQYSLEILSNSCTLKTCTNTFTTANIIDSTSVQTGNVIVGNNLVYSCNSPKVPKQVKCVASLSDDTASFDATPSCIDSTTIGTPGNIPIYQTDVLFKDSGKKFNDVGSTSNDILTAEKVYQLLGKTTIENNYATKFDASNNKLLQSMLFDNATTIGVRSSESTAWSATPPSSKALLELRSTVQGFLPPRMTEQQRNNLVSSLTTTEKTALAGLVVFNTDSGQLQVWDGKSWSEERALETVPIGTIVAWSKSDTNSIPAGWLLLNGQSVLVSEYQDLAAAFPNWVSGSNVNLPDFRGYFLRGAGTNADGTTSGTFLTSQNFATARPTTPFVTDDPGTHRHSFTRNYGGNDFWGNHNHNGNSGAVAQGTSEQSGTATHYTSYDGGHTHSITDGGDSETRPKNIAVHYIIKAREISMSDDNIQAIVEALMENSNVGNRLVKFNSEGTKLVSSVISEKDNGNSTFSLGINTDTPHPKALLQLQSTSQGFMPPRMTQTQRDTIITSLNSETDPVAAKTALAGLIIYNQTTKILETWNGVEWISGGGGIDTTPVGTVVAWTSNTTPPAGWLLLDGQTFITSQYPELAAIFPSGQLPDFRGYFLRGYGTNTDGTTSGTGAFMTFQQDDFKSHTHRIAIETSGGWNGWIPQGSDRGVSGWSNQYVENTGGTETRPKNIAVHYIIKAKAVTLSTSNVQQIAASLNTFTPATASTSGEKGLVPTPAAGDNNAVLRGNGTWRKFIGGTVVIGNIGSITIGTITGDITSASLISNNDDSNSIIQVNFPNMGSDPIINVTQHSIGTWASDNNAAPDGLMIRNVTPTSAQIGVAKFTYGGTTNIKLHVTVLAGS